MRSVAPLLGGLLLTSALSGCTFFYIPADKAAESLHRPIPFVRSERVHPFVSYAHVNSAVSSEFLSPDTQDFLELKEGPAIADSKVLLEFLQVSDAQVRDESVYTPQVREQQGFFDFIVSVSARNPHVEALDSLVLASFLAAYVKRVAKSPSRVHPFIVHTGDALDISLTTELVEVLNVFRAANKDVNVYSVGGNHDGLLYGNINDFWAIDYRMGINLTEFVFGHHAADPRKEGGFGFGRNELYKKLLEYDDTSLAKIQKRLGAKKSRALRIMRGLKQKLERFSRLDEKDQEQVLEDPAALKELIDAGAGGEHKDLQLGYYDWEVTSDEHGPMKGFRCVVLDTRAAFWATGHFSLVQAGWLYDVLCDALAKKQAVLIFAHHDPDGLGKNLLFWDTAGEDALESLLDSFPNIVGYFYGHGHENTVETPDCPEDPVVLQTGSTVDFPQVARLFQIKARPPSDSETEARLRIRTDFVRPQGRKAGDGLLLDGKLGAALRESWLKQTIEEDLWGDITSGRILYWLFAGVDLLSGKGRWARLEPMEFDRTVRFPAKPPTPSEVFGSCDAETVKGQRSVLELGPR